METKYNRKLEEKRDCSIKLSYNGDSWLIEKKFTHYEAKMLIIELLELNKKGIVSYETKDEMIYIAKDKLLGATISQW